MAKTLLASSRIGGAGINMTYAEDALMFDAYFYDAEEEQASAKVFGIG